MSLGHTEDDSDCAAGQKGSVTGTHTGTSHGLPVDRLLLRKSTVEPEWSQQPSSPESSSSSSEISQFYEDFSGTAWTASDSSPG